MLYERVGDIRKFISNWLTFVLDFLLSVPIKVPVVDDVNNDDNVIAFNSCNAYAYNILTLPL